MVVFYYEFENDYIFLFWQQSEEILHTSNQNYLKS